MALAYFITFTTYGPWLHGTAKGAGSVDDAHNVYGTPFIEPDPQREQAARERMDQPPYVMSAAERDIVCQAIVTLSTERGWLLLAVHVRSNHVHVVISADRDPGRLMSDLKARASRDLTRRVRGGDAETLDAARQHPAFVPRRGGPGEDRLYARWTRRTHGMVRQRGAHAVSGIPKPLTACAAL